jgi:hypothetical protein
MGVGDRILALAYEEQGHGGIKLMIIVFALSILKSKSWKWR